MTRIDDDSTSENDGSVFATTDTARIRMRVITALTAPGMAAAAKPVVNGFMSASCSEHDLSDFRLALTTRGGKPALPLRGSRRGARVGGTVRSPRTGPSMDGQLWRPPRRGSGSVDLFEAGRVALHVLPRRVAPKVLPMACRHGHLL